MHKSLRNNRGLSMATILGLGVVAGFWVLGTSKIVVSSAGRVATERAVDVKRCTAEAGIDWAIRGLSNPTTRATYDSATTTLPSTIFADYSSGHPSSYAGVVTVSSVAAPTYSYLYDQSTDSGVAANNIWDGNGWRVVSSTVYPSSYTQAQAAAAGKTKTVRVLLKPNYMTDVQSTTTTGLGPPTPYFNTTIGGNSISGKVNTYKQTSHSGVNATPTAATWSNTGADIYANTTVALGGAGTYIGGSIISYGSPAAVTGSGTVNGNIYNQAGGTSSVTGNHNGPAPTSTAQMTFPPAPVAPANATATTISLSGNTTKTLTAGSYVVSSISIAGNGKLIIDSTNGPVNIYVQGANAGSDAISILGNGVQNTGAPTNLTIFYGGSQNVKIGGNGNISGAVYSPNANVTVNGNGVVYGAVVGNTVTFNGNAGNTVIWDPNLATNAGPTYQPTISTTTNVSGKSVQTFQAVSWQEL